MDALVMCGGRGTRLAADVEKPLFAVAGEPMVDRVLTALRESDVQQVYAVGSPHAPETREHVRRRWLGSYRDMEFIDAPGEGYVSDLQYALDRISTPVLTAASDLPLLEGDVVDRVVDHYDGGSLTVHVPTALKRQLGVRAETTAPENPEVAPTGINVVGDGPEDSYLSYDVRVAVNVNYEADASVAEAIL